jgi:hypothetical protein
VRRLKARKPATDLTVNGPPVSQAGELRNQKLHEDRYAFQAIAVYAGQTCLGFLLPRDKSGIEAFDADEHSLGLFPDQKSAAAAVSEAAK